MRCLQHLDPSVKLMSEEYLESALLAISSSFEWLCQAGVLDDVDVTPYLPEPKNF